jgi:hypothetical protein
VTVGFHEAFDRERELWLEGHGGTEDGMTPGFGEALDPDDAAQVESTLYYRRVRRAWEEADAILAKIWSLWSRVLEPVWINPRFWVGRVIRGGGA